MYLHFEDAVYLYDTAVSAQVQADFEQTFPRCREITAEQLYYKNKISGFLGKKGVGMPVMTILRGEIIAENGSWTGKKGFGKVLRKGSIS